jgi:predicted GNAT family acetyltransferase
MAGFRADEEAKLDEALQATFPASDPPANTLETGILICELPAPAGGSVTDNQQESRFEISANGETAFLAYTRTNETLTLVHTEVPTALRGLHLGDALAEAALRSGRSQGLRIIAVCPFVRAYMRKHPGSEQQRTIKQE